MKKQRPSPKTLFGANTSSFYPCNGARPLPIQTACSFYPCNGARPLPIRLEALRSFGTTSSLGTVPNLHPPVRRVVSRMPGLALANTEGERKWSDLEMLVLYCTLCKHVETKTQDSGGIIAPGGQASRLS